MKIIEKIVDVNTGEETFVERDETAQEIAERLEHEAQKEAAKIELETKAAVKADLLAKLGITAEEAALLLA